MKLEKGMFIRTKDGMIYKNYGGGTNFFGDTVIYVNGENNLYDSVINVDIIKASFNIIDLIEAGDYVNGYKVQGFNGLGQIIYSKDAYGGGYSYVANFKHEDIKSIVTHEQFESMQYKVD